MRVALIGAAGTIAPAIVRDLAESDEVESILLLDLRGDVAERVASELGGGKATSRAADAREGLASYLGDVDVLINSASYRINLDAMRACLEAGCDYIDLGGLYHVAGEQLALHDDFAAAGRLAILGIGSSPGKTNLMAARVIAELREQNDGEELDVEEIDVMAGGRDLRPTPGLAVPYSLQTLLDELSLPPIVLRDGEPVEVEPLSDGGEVDFGEPIGPGSTIYTLHSELMTFGESFGCRECTFRLSLPPAALNRLSELAGAGEEEVRAAARSVVPQSSRTASVHMVDVRAAQGAARMRAVTWPHDEWGLGGGIVSTAAPAAAAVRLLARGKISAAGVLPPERCIDPEEMFAELRTRGCQFELSSMEATH